MLALSSLSPEDAELGLVVIAVIVSLFGLGVYFFRNG